MLARSRGVGAPTSGKSWIRHWSVMFHIIYINAPWWWIQDLPEEAPICLPPPPGSATTYSNFVDHCYDQSIRNNFNVF